jgi:uncharacterized protein YpuA (DUF1002 family)
MPAMMRTILCLLAFGLLAPMTSAAAGQTQVVYGADTTPSQRSELAKIFGVDRSTPAETVTTTDISNATQTSGLPLTPADKSIASSAVACTGSGSGLTVRTQNITRVSPFVYASALVAAGVADSSVTIAAPPDQPVTGEAALVAALKNPPTCQGSRPLDPARVSLAYKQVAWSLALAPQNGDPVTAASMLMRAEAPIVAGQAETDAATAAAIDTSAGETGVAVSDYYRAALLDFLSAFRGRDFGQYAGGYSIEPSSPAEVRVVPTTTALAAGRRFSGTVQRASPALTVHSGNRVLPINLVPTSAVTRNGAAAALSALRTGDRVTITLNPDGTAQQVTASGAGGPSMNWLAWPVVVLLLLAALIVLEVTRSRHDDSFVLEPNAAQRRAS